MRKVNAGLMIVLALLLSLPVSAAITHRYSFADNPDPNDPNTLDSVGTQHGMPMNATGIDPTIISGGQAVLAGGQYINLPGPEIDIPSYSAVTIEQWITSSASNTGFTMTFVTGRTEADGVGWEYLDMQPTRNGGTTDGCRFTITNTQWSTESWSQTSQMNDGIEHHLVGVCDGVNIQLFVDGVAMPSMALTTQSIGALSNIVCYLGRSCYNGDAYFIGSINETRIYDSALSVPAVILNNQLGPDIYMACALTDMSPANNATNVPVLAPLSWAVDPAIDTPTFEVFVKTDPNLLDPNAVPVPTSPVYSGANTSYTLTTALANLTDYYWRVDTIDSSDTRYPGPVYKFKTAPASPIFTVNPGITAVFPGESAVLTATASSVTPLTDVIRWYKVGTPDVEITEADPDVTIDETFTAPLTTSTLTIANVALAREGQYYAKATNSGGTGTSTNGKIIVKRLLAHYPFEGNANDVSGSGLNGTEMGTGITYPAGKFGQAVSLVSANSNYIDLPDDFAEFRSGITINLWANPSAAGGWANFIQFSNGAPSDNIFFCRAGTSTNLQFRTANGTAQNTAIVGNGAIALNQWQMFTVTLDASGVAKLYKNGLRYFYYNVDGTTTTPQVTMPLPNNVTRVNNYIGRSAWNDAYYSGMMDEIRIYNYALTDDDIAQIYITDSAIPSMCQIKPAYDYTGDCQENLADFLLFASQWLDCGLYPASACP